MAMKVTIVLLLAVCSQAFGLSSRIIGGSAASIHDYPFAAAIDVQTPTSRLFCGGALYTNQWILTAGQCVDGATLFTVHLGSAKLSDPNKVSVATNDYVLHPEYDPATLANDIGLIKLRLPILFTDSIKSVNYLAIEPLTQKQIVRAIGWGQTSDDDAEFADNLQAVFVIPLNNNECSAVYGDQISNNTVCVEGNLNEGACYGDTGSPLIDIYARYHTVHVGISSFVSGNGCESTDPSGYIRTYNYVDWIQNVTAST